MSSSLRGLHIVVTRPKHQAVELRRQLETLGAAVIEFPLMGIEALEDSDVSESIADQDCDFDLVIFISPNAVEYGLPQLQKRGLLTAQSEIAAVGKGSAKALQQRGIAVQVVPEQRFDSEALLALPRLQAVDDQQIAIVKGEGGRELLTNTLRERGAEVTEIACYRRVKPDSDPKVLYPYWQNHQLDLIIVTSNEGLTNLYDMVSEAIRPALLKTQLIVLSQRAVTLAAELGFQKIPRVAAQASDAGLVEAVQSWSSTYVGKG